MDEAIERAKQAAIQADDLWDHHAYAVWIAKAVAEEAARQAAEQMRERCKEIVNKHVGNFYDREETIAAIRALTLEEKD